MFIAALDIGGTKMAACLADASGPRVRVIAPTVLQGAPDAVARQGLQMLEAAGFSGARLLPTRIPLQVRALAARKPE